MIHNLKRELGSSSNSKSRNVTGTGEAERSNEYDEDVSARRLLRSHYRSVKSLIVDEREEISSADSNKFNMIIDKLENLYQQVRKPREQVVDAETLLDITSAMVSSVQAQNNGGINVSDFVSCLIRDFGQQSGPNGSREDGRMSLAWVDIGVAVPHVFDTNLGCSTMIGPMNNGLKQRKVAICRTHVRPTEITQPVEVDDGVTETRTDTDKNMLTMFNILRKNRRVRLENLVLNRNSFAQTVENLFTLSFLVKDGRAEIQVDETGGHLVSPKNAPAASAIASKEVAYHHFVFRFDYKDWKLMITCVKVGEELMPHRSEMNTSSSCGPDRAEDESQETALTTTPIRKLSRNRGLVLPEQSVQVASLENDNSATRPTAICKGKRKVR